LLLGPGALRKEGSLNPKPHVVDWHGIATGLKKCPSFPTSNANYTIEGWRQKSRHQMMVCILEVQYMYFNQPPKYIFLICKFY